MLYQTLPFRLANVDLATGIRLNYAEQGTTADTPLILLHGLSDSWFSYSRVIPALAASHRIYALDQRGHGDSDRPEQGYAMTDFADDVVAFMDALQITRAVLVGHSMGSVVATTVALAAPERVAGLILIGARPSWNDPEIVGLQQALDTFDDPMPAAFVREFQASTVYEPLPDAFMERVVAESLKLPVRVWRAAAAGVVDADYSARLGQIQMPTLVLGGEQDSWCSPPLQKEAADRLANAQLKLYAYTSHSPHWERPDQFTYDVEAFLMRLTAL